MKGVLVFRCTVAAPEPLCGNSRREYEVVEQSLAGETSTVGNSMDFRWRSAEVVADPLVKGGSAVAQEVKCY